MSSFALIPREGNRVTIAVYDRHPVNYVANAQVVTKGRVGWMDTITGERFSKLLAPVTPELFAQLGVDRLQGALSRAHLRLMRRDLKGACHVTVLGQVEVAGKQLKKIVVTLDREASRAADVNLERINVMAAKDDKLLVEVIVKATRNDGSEHSTITQRMPGIPKQGLRLIQKAVGEGLFNIPEAVEEAVTA